MEAKHTSCVCVRVRASIYILPHRVVLKALYIPSALLSFCLVDSSDVEPSGIEGLLTVLIFHGLLRAEFLKKVL